jgi:hypothetical protein
MAGMNSHRRFVRCNFMTFLRQRSECPIATTSLRQSSLRARNVEYLPVTVDEQSSDASCWNTA